MNFCAVDKRSYQTEGLTRLIQAAIKPVSICFTRHPSVKKLVAMAERCLAVERYGILSLVTITTAEWCRCCWSLGTTRESGDGRWTLRGNKRKSQLPMNNHETEEGVGGWARPSPRP
ncbi:hypothetical protein E2C01_022975 [Portunus trituberculatus]|uniref:Uncharacterized protein n=1 Tax=Portunus trituberculatus TaxID=210409 RepID=A0A5B7E8P7_PORTR|nr:hypothetical protein [Portunus trituberculatus]